MYPSRRLQTAALLLFYPAGYAIIALQGSLVDPSYGAALLVATILQCAWLLLMWRASDARLRTLFVLALIVNIFGEVLCLNVFAFYAYHDGNLPAYVVLGHGMLVWWTTALVGRIPEARAHQAAWVASGLAVLTLGISLAFTHDLASVALFALLPIALLLTRTPTARLAVALSFWVGISIELFGASLSAWVWSVSYGFTNPPVGAGGLYALAEAIILRALPSFAEER